MIKDWKHGEQVFFDSKLVRRVQDTLRYWEAVSVSQEEPGLLLGVRTLYNGSWISEYNPEGNTFYFSTSSHFQVALVSPNKKQNSIYVPFDSIRRVGWRKREL